MLDYILEVAESQRKITFRLQVKNRGEEDRCFTFGSSQEVDFVVERDGKPVWRWSADRAFTMAVHDKTVRRGQAMTPYEAAWPKQDSAGNPVGPGKYVVKAYFLGAGRNLPVAQQEFQVAQ